MNEIENLKRLITMALHMLKHQETPNGEPWFELISEMEAVSQQSMQADDVCACTNPAPCVDNYNLCWQCRKPIITS